MPEMQALAERLEAVIGGARMEAPAVLGFSGLKTAEIAPESLAGSTVSRVGRRGKYV